MVITPPVRGRFHLPLSRGCGEVHSVALIWKGVKPPSCQLCVTAACPNLCAHALMQTAVVHIQSSLPNLPGSRYPSWGRSSCLSPSSNPYNNSITSTGPHRDSMINLATCFTGRSIRSVCRTFKAMIWCGSLIIWTRCVATSPFRAPHPSHRRLSSFSILPVPLSESVCVSSGPYAAPGGRSQLRTPSWLTFSKSIPTHSPGEVMAMCTRGSSTGQGFASSVCACTLTMIRRRQRE